MNKHEHSHHMAEKITCHAIHLGLAVTTVVLASEILKKLCKIHKGLKEMREGRREVLEELHLAKRK